MQEFAGIHLGGDQLANVGDGLGRFDLMCLDAFSCLTQLNNKEYSDTTTTIEMAVLCSEFAMLTKQHT